MHLAVEKGHMSVAEMLLGRGADPRKENEDGDTPLSLADEFCYCELATAMVNGRDIP